MRRVSESLKDLEVSRHLVALKRPIDKRLKESEENVIGSWRKLDPFHVTRESLATLLPEVKLKKEMYLINWMI